MQITLIHYEQVFPTEPYANVKIGVDVACNDGENPQEALQRARAFVLRNGPTSPEPEPDPEPPPPAYDPTDDAPRADDPDWAEFTSATARPQPEPTRPDAQAHRAAETGQIPPQASRAGGVATEKQVKAIYAIGRNVCGMDQGQVDAEAVRLYGRPATQLSKAQASTFIDALRGAAAQAS